MSKVQVINELWQFMRENKKFWLAPIVITLVAVGVLLVLAKGSAIAPRRNLNIRKLPQSAMPLMRRTLAYEIAAVVHNDRGEDADVLSLRVDHKPRVWRL